MIRVPISGMPFSFLDFIDSGTEILGQRLHTQKTRKSRWADNWINSNENPRSAIALEEKRRIKARTLGPLGGSRRLGLLAIHRSYVPHVHEPDFV